MILRKYVKCSVYDIENIARKSICYTTPECFNDPIDAYFLNSPVDKFKTIKAILTSEIINQIRISCFFDYEKIRDTNKNTLTPQELLMWTYYANSHKGICLEYDVPRNNFDFIEPTNDFDETRKFIQEVRYIDNLAIDYNQLFRNIADYKGYEDLLQTVYFAKDKAFENEKEIRALIYDKSGTNYLPAEFPYLKKIVFGYKCSKDTKYVINCLNKQIYNNSLTLLEVSNSFSEVLYVEK